MAVPTQNEIAESLWNVQNTFPFAEAKETDRKRYLELAEGLIVLVKLTYLEGLADGVSEAQYLTGMTDETVQGIFDNLGVDNPLSRMP